MLNASTGTWTNGPSGYSYQWQRCGAGGSGCAAIAGATSSSYQLQATDVGSTVRVTVTASNAAGSSLPAQSGATASSSPTRRSGTRRAPRASRVARSTRLRTRSTATRHAVVVGSGRRRLVAGGSRSSAVRLDRRPELGGRVRLLVQAAGLVERTTFTDVATASASGAGRVVTTFPTTSARYVRFQGVTRGTV